MANPHPSPFRFRSIVAGVERLRAGSDMPRHQHLHAYATIVLDGSFEEIGYAGRIRAEPGDLLIHGALDTHMNRMLSQGVTLMRLPWGSRPGAEGRYRLGVVDSIARLAQRDAHEAVDAIEEILAVQEAVPESAGDWPDQLAAELGANTVDSLQSWAANRGLASETISRGFKLLFGVVPSRFRLELHARKAWQAITSGENALADIAAASGFADQAHMTRAVRRFTGCTPMEWRRMRKDMCTAGTSRPRIAGH
jgi:AraC-like DNA-binding protein